MKGNEFSLLATELGLNAYGAQLCGVVGGWPISVFNNRFGHIRVMTDGKKDRAVRKRLEELLKPRGGRIYSWTRNTLILTAGNEKKNPGGKADYILFCTYALTRAGLCPLDHCPYCGAPFCDTSAMTGRDYRLVHLRCLREAADKARDKAESNGHNGSYLLGALGGILGMIVGTIPTLLTVYFMSMENSLLFALIPICVYFGYKLFGGKMNRSALILSVVLSVAAVFLINFELVALFIMDEYGASFGEAMRVMPEILTDGSFWAEVALNSLQEYLFTGLGLIVAWRLISVTDAGSADELAAALRLAKSYDRKEASSWYSGTDEQ